MERKSREKIPIRLRLLLPLWFLVLCGATLPQTQSAEVHRYLETQGDRVTTVHWILEREPEMRLFWVSGGETSITSSDASLRTVQWEKRHPKEGTHVLIRRLENRLQIQGSWEGEAVSMDRGIDDAPWYQATSLALRKLVFSSAMEDTFWTLRPDTLKVYKMTAEKVDEETISVNGESIPTEKIRLSVNGVPRLIYESHYWFRKEDGVFVRFEGPGGPPGHPRIHIEYAGEAELPLPAFSAATPSG
jgi:hypothetical protein